LVAVGGRDGLFVVQLSCFLFTLTLQAPPKVSPDRPTTPLKSMLESEILVGPWSAGALKARPAKNVP